jgi:hypothetical protein
MPLSSRWPRDLAFSPDAKSLALVTDDGVLTLWSLVFPVPAKTGG